MPGLPNHFYVTLFSSSALQIYANNTIAAFTVKLSQPIDLGGSNENWEVGVCEISCPPPNVNPGGKPVVFFVNTNILIYCNLISPQFVGDQTVRVLRTFITKSQPCEYRFAEVYYVPVEQKFSRHPDRVIENGRHALQI